MRRGLPIALALVLLGSTLLPAAEAATKKGAGAASASRTGTITLLFILAVVGAALLAGALVLAWWAGRPPRKAPKKKTFASGRAAALKRHPRSVQEALRALPRAHLGEVVEAREDGTGRVVVSLLRKRGHSCEEVAGYLAGALESAWATEVRVSHPQCGGRSRRQPCRFDVVRSPPRIIRGAGRAAAASTRG